MEVVREWRGRGYVCRGHGHGYRRDQGEWLCLLSRLALYQRMWLCLEGDVGGGVARSLGGVALYVGKI